MTQLHFTALGARGGVFYGHAVRARVANLIALRLRCIKLHAAWPVVQQASFLYQYSKLGIIVTVQAMYSTSSPVSHWDGISQKYAHKEFQYMYLSKWKLK